MSLIINDITKKKAELERTNNDLEKRILQKKGIVKS
jgi:hypothetical protein